MKFNWQERVLDALDKIADIINPDSAAEVPETYTDGVATSLERIAEHYETGVELPSVTSSDNGDVLTVVNGAWAKAAPQADFPKSITQMTGKCLPCTMGDGRR